VTVRVYVTLVCWTDTGVCDCTCVCDAVCVYVTLACWTDTGVCDCMYVTLVCWTDTGVCDCMCVYQRPQSVQPAND